MKQFIKTHKTESIIGGICILMLLFLIIFTKIFFFSEKSNVYGTRLEGIEDVKISQDKLDKVSIELKKSNSITKVESNVTGKIINFLVTVNDGSNLETVQTEATQILEDFNKKEKEFYDMQIFLINDNAKEAYPSIGYKGKKETSFLWVHS